MSQSGARATFKLKLMINIAEVHVVKSSLINNKESS